MQISRFVMSKRLRGRTFIGASLLVACLQAGAASALSFNFEFSGFGFPTNPGTVTGTVDGLVDNLNNQTTGLTVTIASATNGPSGIVFTDADYNSGDGFDVASGQVTGVNIRWTSGILNLYLGNQGGFDPQYTDFDFNNYDFSNSLVFTPSSQEPVPGALPIFGGGAAFGWSRRLRRRIKTTI
jgi:hypothetical protein